MTRTANPPTRPASAPGPADLVAFEVRVLDAETVLDEVVAHRRAAEASEARVLMLAVHYVDLHPVTLEHPAASAAVGDRMLGDRMLGDRMLGVRGLGDLPDAADAADVAGLLAGEGTPGIAEYAVEELGAVLGVPYLTAYALVADSVAVCYRHPRIWDRLHAGLVPAWRTRMVAHETTGLSLEAARFVDAQVAILIDRRRFPTLRGLRDLVHEARLRVDPDHEQALEEQALARRGVWFDHQTSTASAATTTMSATLDAWDALDLDAALTGVAADLHAVGDTRDLDLRRAEALALLANPQRVLDLSAAAAAGDDNTDTDTGTDTDAGAKTDAPATAQRSRTSVINLYVHASLADLAQAGIAPSRPVSVEKLGPMLLSSLRGWLGRTDRIVVHPVLDPTDPNSPAVRPVDRHDPPPAMRDAVILRDGACVFPGCRVDARSCDLDHIDPYLDRDNGGPPGQTRPGNLASLCRRHHRLKTFTGWDYSLDPDGSSTWVSPRGQTFLTHPLPTRAPTH